MNMYLVTPVQYETLQKIWQRMAQAAKRNDKAEIEGSEAAFQTWKRQVEQ